MDPATISIIIGLLVKYGPEVAQKAHDIYENIRNGKATTPEQLQALLTLTAKTAESQMVDALARNGIDPNSAAGKADIALVS